MFGAACLVALFSILSALIALFPPGENQNLAAQKAAIGMIFMMSIVFSMSFGPVSWVLASEVSSSASQTRTRRYAGRMNSRCFLHGRGPLARALLRAPTGCSTRYFPKCRRLGWRMWAGNFTCSLSS